MSSIRSSEEAGVPLDASVDEQACIRVRADISGSRSEPVSEPDALQAFAAETSDATIKRHLPRTIVADQAKIEPPLLDSGQGGSRDAQSMGRLNVLLSDADSLLSFPCERSEPPSVLAIEPHGGGVTPHDTTNVVAELKPDREPSRELRAGQQAPGLDRAIQDGRAMRSTPVLGTLRRRVVRGITHLAQRVLVLRHGVAAIGRLATSQCWPCMRLSSFGRALREGARVLTATEWMKGLLTGKMNLVFTRRIALSLAFYASGVAVVGLVESLATLPDPNMPTLTAPAMMPTASTSSQLQPGPRRGVGTVGAPVPAIVATVGRRERDVRSRTGSVKARALSVPSHRGTLEVRSSPKGARVYVNGADVGATPIVLRNISIGSRAVRVELEGYQRWSAAVRVVANRRTLATVNLRPSSTSSPVEVRHREVDGRSTSIEQ